MDRRSLIVALADALEVAPSELIKLPVPAPANGETDAAIEAVRLALMAAGHGLPGGQVLPAEALRARVTATVDALCRCEREREVSAALPGLIRDVHTSIAAGRDVAELLGLAAWLHTLARVRGRHGDAGAALRRAELISPHRIQRDSVVRDVLAELLTRSRQDSIGRELRGIAYRAGLPV